MQNLVALGGSEGCRRAPAKKKSAVAASRPCRLAVRTEPSHGSNSGSNPGRVTRKAPGEIQGPFCLFGVSGSGRARRRSRTWTSIPPSSENRVPSRVGDLRLRSEPGRLIGESVPPGWTAQPRPVPVPGRSPGTGAAGADVTLLTGPGTSLLPVLLPVGLAALLVWVAARLDALAGRRRFVLHFASELLRLELLPRSGRGRPLHAEIAFDDVTAVEVVEELPGGLGLRLTWTVEGTSRRQWLLRGARAAEGESLYRIWRMLRNAFGLADTPASRGAEVRRRQGAARGGARDRGSTAARSALRGSERCGSAFARVGGALRPAAFAFGSGLRERSADWAARRSAPGTALEARCGPCVAAQGAARRRSCASASAQPLEGERFGDLVRGAIGLGRAATERAPRRAASASFSRATSTRPAAVQGEECALQRPAQGLVGVRALAELAVARSAPARFVRVEISHGQLNPPCGATYCNCPHAERPAPRDPCGAPVSPCARRVHPLKELAHSGLEEVPMHSLRIRERLKGRLAAWRQSTREPGGPGIPGRSEEHERPTARGTPVDAQSRGHPGAARPRAAHAPHAAGVVNPGDG